MTFPNPSLLTHPNIPKPLHGVSPRVILGENWWNMERHLAYAEHGFCCWACGVHKSNTENRWLEGHESYGINYATGEVTLKEIVALCTTCHTFIHSGRLAARFASGKVSAAQVRGILLYGFRILHMAGLRAFDGTFLLAMAICNKDDAHPEADELFTLAQATAQLPGPGPIEQFAPWSEWNLLLNGRRYYSKFANEHEWQQFYYNNGE